MALASIPMQEDDIKLAHCRALLENHHDSQAEALMQTSSCAEAMASVIDDAARTRLRTILADVAERPGGPRILATLDADVCSWAGAGTGGGRRLTCAFAYLY